MSTLLERMQNTGSIKSTVISESDYFTNPSEPIQTSVPIINCAFTGELTGGIIPGLSVFAGESKCFKSNLGLICIRAYLKQKPNALCIFYDSEYGVTPEYLKAHGIDPSRVLHCEIEHIEQLKFDITKKLDELSDKDDVIIFIDSIGNLASKKEVEDAIDEKSVSDMTRAKSLKSLFRIITPKLIKKHIPCIVINHTYSEQGMFPKEIMSGGRGLYYSANSIFFITRSQEKDGTDLIGFNFTINVEKSRFVREKSKMKFTVKYESGVSRYSGLLDLALESGYVVKPKNGWYSKVNIDTGEVEEKKFREADTYNKDFWTTILSNKKFHEFVKNKYKLAVNEIQSFEDEDE